LREELAECKPECGPLRTVFIGGGTPSSLPESELGEMLRGVRRTFDWSNQVEFTVECNPESLTCSKARLLVQHGVNRVSLGAQTFSARHRSTLGREAPAAGIEDAVRAARTAGVANINLDLIYGIPGQSLSDWEADLRKALDFGIQHLSTYALTVEEGTKLASAGCAPQHDDALVEMWSLAEHVAREAGLERYEVSNFAVPGGECRHNLEIWHGGAYFGCGPSAGSYDGRLRWTNPPTLERWLKKHAREKDVLPPTARAVEALVFGLRTTRGWSARQFRERTGMDYEKLRGTALDGLVSDGLLTRDGELVKPTSRGLLFADWIAECLL